MFLDSHVQPVVYFDLRQCVGDRRSARELFGRRQLQFESSIRAITIAGLLYAINEQPVGSQAYTCSTTSTTPPLIRPEGFAEKVAMLS